MTLKEAATVILTEWSIQQKDEISKGVGSIKQVFPMKSNPNYIIKTFPKKYNSHIKKEEVFFKAHPNLFAAIIRVNYEKGYMIQEKLDTKKFLDALYETIGFIKKDLENKNIDIGNTEGDQLELFMKYNSNLRRLNLTPIEDLFPSGSFAITLLDFINTLQNITATSRGVDLHQFNVGLDWEGNIKLLDL